MVKENGLRSEKSKLRMADRKRKYDTRIVNFRKQSTEDLRNYEEAIVLDPEKHISHDMEAEAELQDFKRPHPNCHIERNVSTKNLETKTFARK